MTRRRRRTKFSEKKEDKQVVERKPEGHYSSHGGYAAIRRFNERRMDLRRVEDRKIKAWQESIIADCGGDEVFDTFQIALLDRSTECIIILSAIGDYVMENGIMDKKTGDVVPCLRSTYTMYLSAFKTTMKEIFDRAGKKIAEKEIKPPPNLGKYIKTQFGEKQ